MLTGDFTMVTAKMVKSADKTSRGFLVKKNNLATGLDASGNLNLNFVNQSEIKFLVPRFINLIKMTSLKVHFNLRLENTVNIAW